MKKICILMVFGFASTYNTIACATGLHVDEGKWLRNKQYVSDYLRFWFSDEGEPRQYSSWLATAVYTFCQNSGDFTLAEDLFPKLVDNYSKWGEIQVPSWLNDISGW